MKPAQIRRLAKNICVIPCPDVNDRILTCAGAALTRATERQSTTVSPDSPALRTILQSRLIELAVAGMTIAAAIIITVNIYRQSAKPEYDAAVMQGNSLVAPRTNEPAIAQLPRAADSADDEQESKADMQNASVAKVERQQLRARASSADSRARRFSPNAAKIEADAARIAEMAAADDIAGLVDMLSAGGFASKVAAAEHLGEIGDDTALPQLQTLNEEHGGWVVPFIGHTDSGAFAVAICRILTRNLPSQEQIEAWFDVLEGRGPAVPQAARQPYVMFNRDMGERVATELDKFDDPSVLARLRKSENRGAAVHAVWMEVRDLEVDSAIARCIEIVRTEDGAQRYGAIDCLDKFGGQAIDALDELALEGHMRAVMVLGHQKTSPGVLELICWHLTNNRNSQVRFEAVVKLHGDDTAHPGVVPSLIEALYDPLDSVRRRAAQSLCYANYKKTLHLQELEEAMLIALKHPDKEVRDYATKALERLGSQRIGEATADPPPFRSDLEVRSREPRTLLQQLLAKVEPIEKKAAKSLEYGPPEDAVKLYQQLLELRPDYEPYEKALETARAYIKAAAETTGIWHPDAPYINIKGRYSYLLSHKPTDLSTLLDEYELTWYLSGENFGDWTSLPEDHPMYHDQHKKAMSLAEHIVEYYPSNEYRAMAAKAQLAGLTLNLKRDVRQAAMHYIDVFAIPADDIVDSTDERRNKPLSEHGGKTRAQLDFERYFKDNLRARVIEICLWRDSRAELLDRIIEECSTTDPKIVEMARSAKLKIEQ